MRFLFIFFALTPLISHGQFKLKGIVRDSVTKEPFPGIVVFIKSQSTGTTTNAGGEFEIESYSASAEVTFWFIGLKTKVCVINAGVPVTVDVSFEEELYEDLNKTWLKNLKSLDKTNQWKMIRDKYFIATNDRNVTQDDPLLIIDGIPLPITDSLTEKSRAKLTSLLTEDKIGDIKIIDQEPEGVYINKAFTGLILITLNDKKTSKKVRKLKLE